jgi:hypothetical protein
LVHVSLLKNLPAFPLPECAYHVDDQWMSIYHFLQKNLIKPSGIEHYSDLFQTLEHGHECVGADSLAALGTRELSVRQLAQFFHIRFVSHGALESSKKLAYYTCFFGGNYNYSKLIPPLPSETEDCYYFTNNRDIYDRLAGTRWIRIFMDAIPIHDDPVKDTMESKEIRSCPHRFEQLAAYDYLCWFDSKLQVYKDVVNRCLDALESSEQCVVLTQHPYSATYKTVWDEYNLAITCDKYRQQADQYKSYIQSQLAKGRSESISVFYCGGFSLRKRCDKTTEFNECWYQHIQECGINDQIALQFVELQFRPFIHGLKYQESWKYFYE